ncbi:hypothetical protein Gotri_022651 [Gossypium trilobum]|uniref:Uncharacterized protein n=1 Tax=Gossypium trilobum TaxID=34281 RepID=A0A7J9DGY9_9ROSI|nr:hypothetical protein [Gossypium trilobum]
MVFSSRFSSKSSRYFEEDRSVCFGYLRTNHLPKGSWAHRSCGSGFLRKIPE